MKDFSKPFPSCIKTRVIFQQAPTVSITVNENIKTNLVDGVVYLSGYQDNNFSYNAMHSKPLSFQIQRKVISKSVGGHCDVVEDQNKFIRRR